MAKLPVNLTKGKALFATIATVVGPQVVELLRDPARAKQLKDLVAGFGPALRARTAEGRLDAKIAALRAHVEAVQPGDPAHDRLQGWRPRLAALDTKRNLVVQAYTGRQRARQLKAVSRQVDDLLLEFLQASDDAISGASTPPAWDDQP